MPISGWSSGVMSAPERRIHPLLVREEEAMPELPAPLAEEARNKLATLSAAAHRNGVDLQISADRAEETRSVLAFSDFIARTCQRHPDLLAELLQSGDLTRTYPPGTYRDMLPTVSEDPREVAATEPG